jgi:hypothetical protein
MKLNFKINLLILLLILSISCKPLKNLSPQNFEVEKIKKGEYEKLNGVYYNNQDTVFGNFIHLPGDHIDPKKIELINRLFFFFDENNWGKESSVELNFLSNKKAVVNCYQNDSLVYSKIIKGKLKKNYFYVRTTIFIIPFYPVFYWHNFEKVRIGKVGNHLIVDHTLNSYGFMLFAGGSINGRTSSIYLRVDNKN